MVLVVVGATAAALSIAIFFVAFAATAALAIAVTAATTFSVALATAAVVLERLHFVLGCLANADYLDGKVQILAG